MQVDRRDPKNFIKFNLLQRFQDNLEDKRIEFNRLKEAIEFQRKKQALFKETLETKEHTIGNGLRQEDDESIKRLKEENDLKINIQMTGDIVDSAEHLEQVLNYQKSRLMGVSKKVKSITSKTIFSRFPNFGFFYIRCDSGSESHFEQNSVHEDPKRGHNLLSHYVSFPGFPV
jgi:translation initiation factor IF-2